MYIIYIYLSLSIYLSIYLHHEYPINIPIYGFKPGGPQPASVCSILSCAASNSDFAICNSSWDASSSTCNRGRCEWPWNNRHFYRLRMCMAMSSWKHIWVIYILFLNFNISHLYIERNRERERDIYAQNCRHPVCLKTSKDPSKQSTTIPPCKGSQQFSSGTLRWHRGTCNFLGQLSWGAPGVPCHRLRSTSQAARDRATKAKVRRPVCAFRGSRAPKLTQKTQGKNGEKTGRCWLKGSSFGAKWFSIHFIHGFIIGM